MVETTIRVTGCILNLRNQNVGVTFHEEYWPGESSPRRVTCYGPNGLKTEGETKEAWRQMQELLGIAPPPDPPEEEAAPAAAGDEGVASPEPSCHAREQLALAEPAAGAAESAPIAALQDVALQDEREVEEEDEDEDEDESPLAATRNNRQTSAEQPNVERDPARNRNVVEDTLIKLLNQRVYSDDPPLKITAADVAGIPGISSTQEAADFIDVIQENIDLINMRADAAMRAKKLEDLKKANAAKRCRHIKFSGEDCGSPALRGQEYCHFHAQMHAGCFDIPLIEDQRSLQVAFARLATQVASNKIDAAHAGVLLRILESAGRSLPAEAEAAIP